MKKLSIIVSLIVLSVSSLLAQTKVITGTVTSAVASIHPITLSFKQINDYQSE